jgi:hypothetical protein
MINISEWYGRLGNNITQLKNAISIGLYYKMNVVLPKHKFFTSEFIKLTDEDNSKTYSAPYYFLPTFEDFKIDKEAVYSTNIVKTMKIIQSIFLINPYSIQPSLENELLIHIRSGDIMYGNKFDQYYTPPPFYYYKKIIDNNDYKTITLISEDIINPVINKLLSEYPDIKFKINNLHHDITLILKHKNIVFSIGSFIESLTYVSENIRKLYIPSYAGFITKDIIQKIIIQLNPSYKKDVSNNRKLLLEYES